MDNCKSEKHERIMKTLRDSKESAESVKKASELFAALGDNSRMKIIIALSEGELCVYHICEITGGKQSATSQHLRKLKECNIVKSRKEGNMVLYSLSDEHVASIVRTVLAHLYCG